MKKIDAQEMIDTLEAIARNNYREGEADRADRLAYHVGLLQSKLREVVYILNCDSELIEELKQDLDKAYQ